MKKKQVLLIIVVAVIAAMLGVVAGRLLGPELRDALNDGADSARFAHEPSARPERLPEVSFIDLDGNTVTSSEWLAEGKPLFINFWATWCKPCLQEMPELSALHEMREDIEVVGLAYEDIATEEMQAFLRERPVSYPIVVLDPYAPPGDFATPRGLPMTYLLAPDGKVARQFLGPVSASDIELAVAGKAEG